MKKQLIALTAFAGFVVGASIAYAGSTAGTGIVGSKHDMNLLLASQSAGKQDTQGRVCAFCHTPHHKLDSAALDYNPLWSHTIATDVYTPYGAKTVTFDGMIGTDPLTGPSRLCMSCHDGVIAPDQHYGIAGTNWTGNDHITGDDFGQIAIGLNHDLSNDHPIGFDITNYPAQDATNGGMTVFGSAINANLAAPNNPKLNGKPFTSVGFDFTDGRLIFTCASCHEVHNKDSADDRYFLYEKQAGSQICLMCHNK